MLNVMKFCQLIALVVLGALLSACNGSDVSGGYYMDKGILRVPHRAYVIHQYQLDRGMFEDHFLYVAEPAQSSNANSKLSGDDGDLTDLGFRGIPGSRGLLHVFKINRGFFKEAHYVQILEDGNGTPISNATTTNHSAGKSSNMAITTLSAKFEKLN